MLELYQLALEMEIQTNLETIIQNSQAYTLFQHRLYQPGREIQAVVMSSIEDEPGRRSPTNLLRQRTRLARFGAFIDPTLRPQPPDSRGGVGENRDR